VSFRILAKIADILQNKTSLKAFESFEPGEDEEICKHLIFHQEKIFKEQIN
jgi:hypothetical protein